MIHTKGDTDAGRRDAAASGSLRRSPCARMIGSSLGDVMSGIEVGVGTMPYACSFMARITSNGGTAYSNSSSSTTMLASSRCCSRRANSARSIARHGIKIDGRSTRFLMVQTAHIHPGKRASSITSERSTIADSSKVNSVAALVHGLTNCSSNAAPTSRPGTRTTPSSSPRRRRLNAASISPYPTTERRSSSRSSQPVVAVEEAIPTTRENERMRE